MELVKGVPITDYCDRYNLTPRERLELFATVCQAVQHAHLKGVIHRDIKPSNVLVTLHDGRPVPKVIDFGVSKAINQRLTERTLFTQFAQMVGTPLYMSPEQAEMSGLDVDTRSDVYSLGVLLYELLTGTTPFLKERLHEAAFDEIRRIIREEEPPRPSLRISSLGDTLPGIAAHRHTEPKKLGPLMRGELDWIVMKALDKDRTRRYETANGFGADVLRYLNDEPVQACPPSSAYRFHKFARRNKSALITSALVVVALFGGLALSLWQAVRATNEAQRANVAEQLAGRRLEQVDEQRRRAEDNFNQAEQQRKRAEGNVQLALDALEQVYLPLAEAELSEKVQLTERDHQFLEKTLPFYEKLAEQTADDPQAQYIKARAYLRVGNIYRTLRTRPEEKDDKADKALRQAVALFEQLADRNPDERKYRRDLADAYVRVGQLLSDGRWVAAERAYRRAIEVNAKLVHQTSSRSDRLRLAGAQYELAVRLKDRLRWQEALQLFRESLADSRKLLAEEPNTTDHLVSVARALHGIGNLHEKVRELPRAIGSYRETIDCLEKAPAELRDAPQCQRLLGEALTNLARALHSTGRLDDAEKTYLRARDVLEKLVRRHPAAAWYRNVLGINTLPSFAKFLESRKSFEQAEAAWRRALTLADQLAAELPYSNHPLSAARYRIDLLKLLKQTGRHEEAEQFVRDILAREPSMFQEHLQRGLLYMHHKQFDRALADLDKAAEMSVNPRVLVNDYCLFAKEVAGTRISLGGRGNHAKALPIARRAVEMDPESHNAHAALAEQLIGLGVIRKDLRQSMRPSDCSPMPGGFTSCKRKRTLGCGNILKRWPAWSAPSSSCPATRPILLGSVHRASRNAPMRTSAKAC